MRIDRGEARDLAQSLMAEISKTHNAPVEIRIDYSIGPEGVAGFLFAYTHKPFRLTFDFSDPESTKYRLSDPQEHKIIEYAEVQKFNPSRLHMKILERIRRKEQQ